MTRTARAEERTLERLRLEWEASAEADERSIATEAIAALLSFANTWLEPLAIEARVGCYDREIFTEGDTSPTNPFHILAAEPKPAAVRITPVYYSVESYAPALSSREVQSWVERALSQSCGEGDRFQISLRGLDVRASRTCVPAGWAGDSLAVECYAGTIAIPLEARDGAVWVAAPPATYGLRQPVELSVENRDGYLRFAIDIYWSPWVGENRSAAQSARRRRRPPRGAWLAAGLGVTATSIDCAGEETRTTFVWLNASQRETNVTRSSPLVPNVDRRRTR